MYVSDMWIRPFGCLHSKYIKKVDSKEIWIRSPTSTEFIRQKGKEKHLLYHNK